MLANGETSPEIPKHEVPSEWLYNVIVNVYYHSLCWDYIYLVDSHNSKHQPNKQLDMGEMEALLKS